MKPKVFLYEEQLLEVLASNVEQITGVAYEWKGESVYHVYTKAPQVAPTGYPAVAYIKVFNDLVAFQESRESFYNYLFDHFPKDGAHLLLICLYQGTEKLEHMAHLFDIETVVDCEINFIPLKSELYSRSKGILETDIISEKSVLIVGIGSFGSTIAVEMAKIGVGEFFLIDMDFLELHNIARHQCGINDLGRYKTKAVKDLILQKNPYAKVETHEVSVVKNYQLLHALMAKSDLVICATDNNTSRFAINQAAIKLQKTVIFGRAITRAEGGDVFILKPEYKTCYACLINDDGTNKYSQEEEISTKKQLDDLVPAYMSPTDKEPFIQVGLSSDIAPICNMMVKLALMELNRYTPTAMPCLAKEFKNYNYFFWANRRESHYLNYSPFNDAKGKPSILKWYGTQIPANETCTCCN
jgi:molybdopterin/thiamine biosynthesis adenylyltransferase